MEAQITTRQEKRRTLNHIREYIERLRQMKHQRGFKTYECRRRYERTIQNLESHMADFLDQIKQEVTA